MNWEAEDVPKILDSCCQNDDAISNTHENNLNIIYELKSTIIIYEKHLIITYNKHFKYLSIYVDVIRSHTFIHIVCAVYTHT